MIRIAINGFGRIGRLTFRKVFGDSNYEVVAINDLTSPDMLAYLLKYDSVQGPFRDHTVENDENSITVDGKQIRIYSEADRSVGIPASIQYECDRCGQICGFSDWWWDALYDTPDGELCADCIMKIAYPAPVHTPDDAEEFLCCETCGEPDDGTGNLYKDEEGICCAQCALKRIAYPKITK